jgi:1,4-dihydroxy-2-naphthoate octaprenyltransferase
MTGLMVVGVALVLVRFILEQDQIILLVGLAAIAAGFLMTTNYR